MELNLKRFFWLVPLVVVMAASVLAAKGVNHIIEAKLVAAEKRAPAARRPPVRRPEPRPTPTKDAEGVVARNIFCSACEPASAQPVAGPAVLNDPLHPPATALPLALLGTIVSTDPRLSTATIANTQSFRSGLYGLNEEIPGAGPIVAIHPKFVDFKNKAAGERVERIDFLGAAPPLPASAPAMPPPLATGPLPVEGQATPESELIAAVDKGVRKIDETHYEIERSLVDRMLTDPTQVARSARIVPSIQGGKANGFKLYAIRPSSVYAKLGLQNGDTVQSINGFDMTSPDKALEVYTKVKSASSLSVSITRRGQPVTMEYSIK